jgi:Fe-S-cluster-containing dehydrogenase component/formate-dependent nitrite reductase membrane component NrfD
LAHYGFAIDLRKCIGCHACTIACKSEHDIPVGVNRCWVKTVEKGTFPQTQRLFFPVLCNQCDDAPCMNICPTSALFRRHDGIVDLHGDVCIGCRACMAACPYDQLFIDPNTRTAEKCNFCANRIENKLEPACVSVCPTECRIFGDLEDPTSEVAKIVQREAFMVRKPEKGTGPKIFYLGADEAAMRPEIATRPFMFKEGQVKLRPIGSPEPDPERPGDASRRLRHTTPPGLGIRPRAVSAVQGHLDRRDVPVRAVVAAGRPVSARHDRRPHRLRALRHRDLHRAHRRPRAAGAVLLIMTRPNWSSWLARGAFLLAGHSGVASIWVLAAWLGWTGLLTWLAPLALLLALGATAYTGFLFAQGLARDLWQGAHNTIDLIAQAATEGSAAMLLTGIVVAGSVQTIALLALTMAAGATVHISILLLENVLTPSPTRHHELAVRAIRRGPYAWLFWFGAIGLGGAVPVALVWMMLAPSIALSPTFVVPAAAFALAGGFAWEYIWVDAGQAVPNS